jgi:quercetin dioxygenase-like cupin family protein
VREAIIDNERFNLWVGLKLICKLPDYRQVIHDLLESVEPPVNELYGAMHKREGFIFVSSPGAVVPYHMDPEHNFLIQIEGRKTVTIYDRHDPRVLTEEDIEKNYTIGHQRLVLKPELEPLARHFELAPGDCLHIPISTPHYVVNDDSTSISVSVTFKSGRADRRATIYKINHHMRQRGWAPTPFGQSWPRDQLKAYLGAIYLRARDLQRSKRR